MSVNVQFLVPYMWLATVPCLSIRTGSQGALWLTGTLQVLHVLITQVLTFAALKWSTTVHRSDLDSDTVSVNFNLENLP